MEGMGAGAGYRGFAVGANRRAGDFAKGSKKQWDLQKLEQRQKGTEEAFMNFKPVALVGGAKSVDALYGTFAVVPFCSASQALDGTTEPAAMSEQRT